MKRVNRVGPAVLGTLPQPRPTNLDETSARLDDPNFIVLDTREGPAALRRCASRRSRGRCPQLRLEGVGMRNVHALLLISRNWISLSLS